MAPEFDCELSELIAGFRRTLQEASARLSEISEERSAIRSSEGKWSPKEIIGHLIDSAANNHQRFVRAQFRDDLHFPGYRQEEWIAAQHYNDESWANLVQLWQHYNLHLAHVMSAVPPEKLSTLRSLHNLDEIAFETVAKSEPATLEYFMRDYVVHLRHHLGQIPETRELAEN
ncbi:MAG: hypothetical protein QOD75_2683 [Blastocatellia bacterium]|jgi:hypothetical protein|nr:hypothetical protein [Blastocatellia bacterium]